MYTLLNIPGTELCDDARPALLTGRALALFKLGFTVTQAERIAQGACPVCYSWHGPKACAELRAELMKGDN